MSSALSIESSPRPSSRWHYVIVAGLLAMSVAVQVVRDRGWQPYQPTTPVMWFQSGPLLKRVALGFDNLLADVYWIRTLVYYGGMRRAEEGRRSYDLLDPMLTFVTTLDPNFRMAYRFGAIFLTESYPNGPGRPDRAIALLERGLVANPNSWEYMHDIGFVHYWWLQDYKAAGQWFEKAGRLPGAAIWLPALAATTLAQGGDRESSRFLWQQIRDSDDSGWFRENAERRLAQLAAMDVIDELNRASQRFVIREGRPPRTWRELIDAEQLGVIPVDPTGTPYVMEVATGRIDVSPQSQLWPLPTDAQSLQPLPK